MPINNQKLWESWVEKNKDPYGKACIDTAREVMKLLDKKNYKEFDPHRIISDGEKKAKGGGLTGFMAGIVAQIVSTCHSRGEEFRKAWNKHYGVKKEEKGIVNPAIITIQTKE